MRTIEILLREYDVTGDKSFGGAEQLEDMLRMQMEGRQQQQSGARGKKPRLENTRNQGEQEEKNLKKVGDSNGTEVAMEEEIDVTVEDGAVAKNGDEVKAQQAKQGMM